MQEPDYRYGTGPVDLIVRSVLGVFPGGEWVELDTEECLTNAARRRRIIAVRVAALRAAARPPKIPPAAS